MSDNNDIKSGDLLETATGEPTLMIVQVAQETMFSRFNPNVGKTIEEELAEQEENAQKASYPGMKKRRRNKNSAVPDALLSDAE